MQVNGFYVSFMEGKYDPMRHLSNWEVADKLLAIQSSMADLDVNWDYMYGIFDIDKGFGWSVYE